MAKLTLKTVLSGFNLNSINENFQALVSELQNKVLYRDNPSGEPNQWETQQDANSQRLINLPDGVNPSEPFTVRQAASGLAGVQSIGITKTREVATASQALFTAPEYVQGSNNLNVYIDGTRQDENKYLETSSTSFTLTTPASSGEVIEALVNEYPELAGTVAASAVTYTSPGGVATNAQSKLQEKVHALDFAVGDGVTDDTIALQAALDSTTSLIEFGSNTYVISGELILPPAITIDLQNCIIIATHTTGNILRCFHDDTGRPVFKVIGNRASINGGAGVGSNPNLVGLWIDTCNFSRFSGMKFQNLDGYAVVLGATGARDIINITIEDMETSTGQGIKLLSGEVNGVDYEQITDGRIKDCFWTTTASGSKSVEIIANDFSGSYVNPNTASSIFGITFERCSMNPVHTDGGTFIDMRATGASLIYQMQFENCEGELTNSAVSPTNPGIYLEKVTRSSIDFSGQFDESDGIQLVNCQHVDIENAQDGVVDPANTSQFLTVDSNSFGNTFRNLNFVDSQMSTDLGFTAPIAKYYFTNRIQDSGFMNKSEGIVATDVRRVFKTDTMDLIKSSGLFLNPSMSSGSSYTALKNGSGNFEVTCTNQGGFRFDVPAELIGQTVVVRCRYKINSGLGGVTGWKLQASTGGTQQNVTMEITDTFNDMMYMTELTDNRFTIFSTDTQTNVVFEISHLEVFLGGFPYPANYNPTDEIVDEFVKYPFSTTADRPDDTKSTIPKSFRLWDTTLVKPAYWDDGTSQWRSATGAVI